MQTPKLPVLTSSHLLTTSPLQQGMGPPSLFFLAACSARAHLALVRTPLRSPPVLCSAWGAGPALLSEWMAKLALGMGTPRGGHARGVTIGTIHSAKGLEWDAVFVMRFNDRVLPVEYRGQVCWVVRLCLTLQEAMCVLGCRKHHCW